MLRVEPGRHVWIWARTDRDSPTTRDVQDTAAALMWRVLDARGDTNGTMPTLVSKELPEGGARRYSIGPARPCDIARIGDRPHSLPGARTRREDEPGVFAVRADRPIFVAVDFHWRGPVLEIDEWPRRRVNMFGFPVDEPMQLDWLLLDAYDLGEDAPDPRPDQRQGDLIAENLPSGPQFVVLLAIGAFLYFDRKR